MIFCNKEEPDRPDSSDLRHRYRIPNLIEVPVYVKTHGNYRTKSGRARGAVIHYTAGRSLDGAENAIATLTYLASRGLGCLVMDIAGDIYRAKNHDLQEVAYHAGKSSWMGKTSLSYYCFGMEICCAGKLDAGGKSWYGEQYGADKTRLVERQNENQKPGLYHRYTSLRQEHYLTNFLLWQLDVNPDFEIPWIVGHDEIAPGRKSDPGGSLSMTMPQVREYLKKEISR